MHRPVGVYCILLILGIRGLAQTAGSEKMQEPFAWSCHGHPYVGVFASVPFHRTFPDLEFRLTDPLGRTAGYGSHKKKIPYSNYGKTVLPSHPEGSKSLELAVCRAVPGRYTIQVRPHTKLHYTFMITGEDGKYGNESQMASFDGDRNRTCRFWFNFDFKDGKVQIRWSDETGRRLETPECGENPKIGNDRNITFLHPSSNWQ